MSEFGGLWKHENNQHTLVPPKTECACPAVTYATPPMKERRKKQIKKKMQQDTNSLELSIMRFGQSSKERQDIQDTILKNRKLERPRVVHKYEHFRKHPQAFLTTG